MNLNKQYLINKIIYRSQYRGTKEMDILVSSFVKSVIENLDLEELKDLNELVNLNDEDFIKITNNIINSSKLKKNKVINLLIDFKK